MDEIKLTIENNSSKKEAPKESASSKFKNIALGIAGVISSILIPIVGYLFTQNQNNKEIEKSYIELGVKILSQDPKPGTENIRTWAVGLINKHSDIKLEGDAKKDVINNIPIYSDASISLSHHEHLDSSLIKTSGKSVVFIKATEGSAMTDRDLAINIQEAKKYMLPYSIYHFFKPNSSVEKQAQNFNNSIRQYGTVLPITIDLEYDRQPPFGDIVIKDKNAYMDSVTKFISLLDISNRDSIIIYTYGQFARQYLDKRFGKYKLCIPGNSVANFDKDKFGGIWNKADYAIPLNR